MSFSNRKPDPTRIATLLGNTTCFARLPKDALDLLSDHFNTVALEPGETLAREGELGDALYLVVSGSLAVTRMSPNENQPFMLGIVHAGEITGELGLLAGHPRAATIQAAQPSVVGVLGKESFDQLCAQFPEEMAASLDWMVDQFNRFQFANAIADSGFLLELNQEARHDLAASFLALDLPAGQVLFREGEPGDTLYLILSGRVRIEVGSSRAGAEEIPANHLPDAGRAAPGGRVLADLGRGDLLGEMALLTGEPRSATAVAVRDTQLAQLDRPAFDRIVAAHPQQMLGLVSRQLAGRLRAQNAGRRTEGRPPVSIAVLALAHAAKPSGAPEFARELTRQLSAFGPTLHLNSVEVARILGSAPWKSIGSSRATAGDAPAASESRQINAAAERRLLSWLGDQEMAFRHVVYEADESDSPWTSRCLRQADVLFVVADPADAPPEHCATIEELTHGLAASVPQTLVLLHPTDAGSQTYSALPGKTAPWKHALGVSSHQHVRRNNPADVGRIARALNRQSVGLALGGGFALGLAHIGVIDAMRHLQIPIDFVGGTSMGAIIGVACAQEFSHAQMLEVMDKGCAQALKGDYTLPIVSLLTGRKVGLALGKYLEHLDIEDLWLPYFAISASLVHARMVVHREGSALRSVLASSRAPGMFPPLGWDGDVLVDGGLVNNIPADVMRECVGGGTVFAADVSPTTEFKTGAEFGMNLSGWRVAARNANPFRRGQRVGTIADILMRMIRLGGVAHNREIQSRADLYFSIPLQRFSIRDFHLGEEMAKAGFDYATKSLEAWIALHGRPWLGDQGRAQHVQAAPIAPGISGLA